MNENTAHEPGHPPERGSTPDGTAVSPGDPAVLPVGSAAPVRRRWRRIVVAALIVVALFVAATGRIIVWPAQGMPSRVNAIVILGGPGNRLGKGLALARQGRAPILVVSEGLPAPVPASVCQAHNKTFQTICFQPEPGTTQGEAQYIGKMARQHGWHSIVLVTTPDQDTRARIRFARCFTGSVYVVTTPLPLGSWPYEIAYQWGALFKAVALQRSC